MMCAEPMVTAGASKLLWREAVGEGDAPSDAAQTSARSAPSQRMAAWPVGKALDFPPSLGGQSHLSPWVTGAGGRARPRLALPF